MRREAQSIASPIGPAPYPGGMMDAQRRTTTTVEVRTADGLCPARFAVPDSDRKWRAVLMFMDAPGMRPAIEEIAARLADANLDIDQELRLTAASLADALNA